MTFEDRPVPELVDPHDVLVNVKYTGVCGSDVCQPCHYETYERGLTIAHTIWVIYRYTTGNMALSVTLLYEIQWFWGMNRPV